MSNLTVIFQSDGSLGRSILTTWEPEEIKDNSPVSIFSIAKKHELDKIFICDNSFINFIEAHKNSLKLEKQLIWGIKFRIVQNAREQNEESLLTESKVCVWMKNSAGYKDLCRMYSAAHANKDTFYYTGRLDWKTLHQYFTENLYLTVDFYDGFIAKNSLYYNHISIPDFGAIQPVFHIAEHELPFDNIIREKTLEYCKNNNYKTLNSHYCYYYKEIDFRNYMVYRCINNRSKFSKPNIDNLSSNKFGFETFLRKNGQSLI